MRGQSLQGKQRIFGDQQRAGENSVRQRSHTGARYDRRNRPALHCGMNKVVPIQPLAAHSKKQLAHAHRARVDGVAAHRQRAGIDQACRSLQHSARADCRFCQGEFHCPSP